MQAIVERTAGRSLKGGRLASECRSVQKLTMAAMLRQALEVLSIALAKAKGFEWLLQDGA